MKNITKCIDMNVNFILHNIIRVRALFLYKIHRQEDMNMLSFMRRDKLFERIKTKMEIKI